jgi:hypothetical protein
MTIRIICSECGGENVRRDAFAEWDIAKQDWVLSSVFDQGHCEDCGGERALAEEEVGVTREPHGAAPAPTTTSTTGDQHDGCGGIWESADAYGLIDRCSKCGEERA